MKKIFGFFILLSLGFYGKSQHKSSLLGNPDLVAEPLSSINSAGSDISPALVKNELYFSAVPEKYLNREALQKKNKAFYEVYATTLDENGKPASARQPVLGFGEKYHEGPVSYCPATEELFVTLSNMVHPEKVKKMFPKENIRLRLVIMKKTGEKWQITEELPFNTDKFHYAHPAISQTGDTLVFSSDMNPGSIGKSDLFMSVRKNGKWTDPQNLGKVINTEGNELFPTLLPGGILAFASDGHSGSLGGLDIYYTSLPDPEKLINAGSSINSDFDDFGLVVHPGQKVGYFSSNRAGNDDIYSFQIIKRYEFLKGKVIDDRTNQPVSGALVQLLDCNKKVVGNIQSDVQGIFEVETNKNDCPALEVSKTGYETSQKDLANSNAIEIRLKQSLTVMTFKTVDKETGKALLNPKIEIVEGKSDVAALKNNNGVLSLNMSQSANYKLYVTLEGYLPQEVTVSGIGKNGGDYSMEIALEKFAVGKQFILEDLYYDLSKYDIRPDAALVLDRLVKVMNENPELKIEIGSHTDSRASNNYNLILSQNRSNSVVAYLKGKGISANRMVSKEYGETQLMNRCANGVTCSEAEHQANRRTVVKVLKIVK